MKIGIERHCGDQGYLPMELFFNVPESGDYIHFLSQLGIKSYDILWVEKNKQVCTPCRMRKILIYQFGIHGVKINEFEE